MPPTPNYFYFHLTDLLVALGYGLRGPPNQDVVVSKSSTDQSEKPKRVKFQDKTPTVTNKVVSNQGGTSGRQLAPGLLLVQQDSKGKRFCVQINSSLTFTCAENTFQLTRRRNPTIKKWQRQTICSMRDQRLPLMIP